MVRSEQVVINRLRDTDDAALVFLSFEIALNFHACIHRIIAAVVKEIADVSFCQYFVYPSQIRVVDFGGGDFIAACSED